MTDKMTRVRFVDAPPFNLDRWLKNYDLWIDIKEREDGSFYAVMGAEIKDGAVLRSPLGKGESPFSAVVALAVEIEGALLVVDAMGPGRREFRAPRKFIVGEVSPRE